jgi:starch synthase
MDILFVTTELAPFVKVGGLADVAAALPKALRALGHKVTLVLPRFPAFEHGGLLVARRLTPVRVPLGGITYDVTLFDGRLASQVDIVLVDAPGFYDRVADAGPSDAHKPDGVYGERGEDYPDNAARFAVLAYTAAEIARQRAAAGSPFDVVHCQDWPAALVPTYLHKLARETPELVATKTVLTVHNMAHQGVFGREQVAAVGLEPRDFTPDTGEFFGKLNLLKLGLVTADAATTVSPTYARELATEAGGSGLEGVVRALSRPLAGILNGIDYAVWNPAVDATLAARYDAQDTSARVRCKGALQRELGLPLEPAMPLVASIGRMVHQKGTDILAAALPELLRATDAQIAIAGDGDPELVARVEAAVAKSNGRAVFARGAAEPVVHRLLSAADAVVVPSRFEPCGLVQQYAQRYGALPIARATGGLVDTVVDCDAKLETGTGFLFEDDTPRALVAATERALAARALPQWPALVKRVMRLDRSWDGPARRYEALMKNLAK